MNKQNVLEALLWLKKHNTHYADITINESNLDWMNGQNEANIGTQASILKTKDTQRYKIYATEEEVVSNVHKPFENNDLCNDGCDRDIGCMHANENNTLPTGMDAKIMKSSVEIAKKMGQSSEIMKFPPINHDSPIRYILSCTRYSHSNVYGVSTIINHMIFKNLIICIASPLCTNVANMTTQNKFL